jgi:hypothetical protein
MGTMSTLVPAQWEIPQEFRLRLGDEVGRQRLMISDGHLLLILHAPALPGEFNRKGRLYWRNPEGKWKSSDHGNGPGAIKRHIDEFKTLIGELEKDEDEATSAQDYFELTQKIAPLHRSVRNMAAVFQDARKAVPNERDLINFRDQSYDADRSAELLYTNAKHALDFAIAKRSEEQAKASHSMAVSSHRLNVLAGFFFPIATLTAIFGTTLQSGLEEYRPPMPFLVVLIVGIIMGVFLTSFVSRTAKSNFDQIQ